jgi:hypothetical protein
MRQRLHLTRTNFLTQLCSIEEYRALSSGKHDFGLILHYSKSFFCYCGIPARSLSMPSYVTIGLLLTLCMHIGTVEDFDIGWTWTKK